jgi:hypothetical protein
MAQKFLSTFTLYTLAHFIHKGVSISKQCICNLASDTLDHLKILLNSKHHTSTDEVYQFNMFPSLANINRAPRAIKMVKSSVIHIFLDNRYFQLLTITCAYIQFISTYRKNICICSLYNQLLDRKNS